MRKYLPSAESFPAYAMAATGVAFQEEEEKMKARKACALRWPADGSDPPSGAARRLPAQGI